MTVMHERNDPWDIDIPAAFDLHRRRMKVTVTDLAKAINIRRTSLQRLLFGQRRIKIRSFLAMARALGLKPWAILMTDDELATARVLGLDPNEKSRKQRGRHAYKWFGTKFWNTELDK